MKEDSFDPIFDNMTEYLDNPINVDRLFRIFSIPYSYKRQFLPILKKMEEVEFKTFIQKFSAKKFESKILKEIPQLVRLKDFESPGFNIKNTIFIKNAVEFYKQAINASPETKPIFYFYSSQFLLAFIINSFFKYDNRHNHHGLQINFIGNEYDLKKINIKFLKNKGGFYPRVVDFFSIFGFITCFNSFMQERKNLEVNYTIHDSEFNYVTNKKINFQDLLSINLDDYFQKKYYGADRDQYIMHSSILKDHLVLFVASNLARYKPHVWDYILSGEKSDHIINLRNIYENFKHNLFAIRYLITVIKKELEAESNFRSLYMI